MERTTHNRLGVGSNPTAPISFELARMEVVINTGSHPPRSDNCRCKKDVLRGDDGHNNGLLVIVIHIRLGRLNTSPQPVCIKNYFFISHIKNFIF